MFSTFFHSYLFAQVLGFYFLIMAIVLLARVNFYRRFFATLTADYGTILVSASFGLAVGLLIVVTHNFWILEPHVLIVTIVGWLILIKSILWLSIPDTMAAFSKRVYLGAGYYIVVAILAILGIVLISKGFYRFYPELGDFPGL
ncbi:hypothetical protein [Legionella jamestowniensis]|uniref:Integral membrane protein (PIN domain superfamily) n=1 Tax=Legionella jamestowniensis TaxID=455 RepID=A0A0W0UGN5_9GAMM|nr:hypothetical protein [Legionella jamestowniensis]KTD06876.1 Integral membrane protein (PIN domain superfamily) [Legionella jamestowniensis]OCH97620.1 hypothetical protein A8135_14100 [Legionella jamestowniensis]SFL81898.1 hypothetical protein SAMN02746073_2041 [Legionella jamestowniensis DSM 19215]